MQFLCTVHWCTGQDRFNVNELFRTAVEIILKPRQEKPTTRTTTSQCNVYHFAGSYLRTQSIYPGGKCSDGTFIPLLAITYVQTDFPKFSVHRAYFQPAESNYGFYNYNPSQIITNMLVRKQEEDKAFPKKQKKRSQQVSASYSNALKLP